MPGINDSNKKAYNQNRLMVILGVLASLVMFLYSFLPQLYSYFPQLQLSSLIYISKSLFVPIAGIYLFILCAALIYDCFYRKNIFGANIFIGTLILLIVNIVGLPHFINWNASIGYIIMAFIFFVYYFRFPLPE